MATGTINLCGELRFELGDDRLEGGIPRGQARVLFARLALQQAGPLTREQLAEALWGENPPPSRDAALSALLSRLRAALSPAATIEGRSELGLRLPPGVEIDVEVADRALGLAGQALAGGDPETAREQARRAVEIACRGFLPGHRGRWVEERQGELERVELRALEYVAAAGIALGGSGLGEAERAALRLIERDPCRESGYRLLIGLQEDRGDVAAALLSFERLRARLRDELGTVPAGDLLATHRRLLGAAGDRDREPASPPAPLADAIVFPGPLVGRSKTLAKLRTGWRKAVDGQMSLSFVYGEAGIGKTRLCAELADLVSRQGAAVLYGRCDEETFVPFQPFVEAFAHHVAHASPEVLARRLEGGGGELARLLPGLSRALPDLPPPLRGQPESERYRLFEEAAGLVGAMSRERPVLLILDDLHWADPATIAMLRHLLRGRRANRVLVIGTYRPTELAPARPLGGLLAELPRERAATREELAGLDREDVERLVAQLAGRRPPEGFVGALWEGTAGNPFFIREILRHLRERDLIGPGREGWPEDLGAPGIGVPDSVVATISRRLERLDEGTVEVLGQAAAIGPEFSPTLLGDVSGGEPALARALDEATAAGLIHEHGEPVGTYTFSHALVQSTIYARIGPAERGRLHRLIGERLEEAGGEGDAQAAELANQFRRASGPGATSKAIAHSVRAGRHALSQLAYEEAVEHFGWAAAEIERGGGPEEELADVLLRLGRAQNRAGQSTLAKETFRRTAELAQRAGRLDLFARAALGFAGPWLELGTVDPARIDLLEKALAVGGPDDSADRAALMARLALEAYYSGPERREELSREAVEVARRLGDGAALARTLMSRRVAISGSADIDQRLAVSTELVEFARAAGAGEMELWGHIWRSTDYLDRGEVEAAYGEFERYGELARELRQPAFLWQPPLFEAMRALLEGRLAEIEALIAEGLEVGARAHDPNAGNYFGILAFMLRREQGRLAEVEGEVRAFVERYPAVPAWRCGLALLYAELGREEEARNELETLGANGFTDLPRDINWLPAMAWLAVTSGLLGDERQARPLYELLLPHAHRNVTTGHPIFCLGSASHHLGLLAGAMGRYDLACTHFETAAALNERMGADAALTRTRYEQGRALLAQGGAVAPAGEQMVAGALAEAERMGLERLLARADRHRREP